MKPTGRFYTFLGTSFMMWMAANQTQVNWLYVTGALLAAVIPAAYWGSRTALRGLSTTRQLNDGDRFAEIHEGDDLTVTLAAHASRRPLAQITLMESCPLAPPDHDRHTFNAYFPRLRPNTPRVSKLHRPGLPTRIAHLPTRYRPNESSLRPVPPGAIATRSNGGARLSRSAPTLPR